MTRDTFEEISSTDELFQPPVTELNFPVITAIQTLPYNRLSNNWKDFERLCLRLVQAIDRGETNDIQLYKKEGNKQDGIDICKVYPKEGMYDVYQCKHYNTFTKSHIRKAVNEVKKNAFWGKIRKFYICTSADLSKYDGLINDLKIELAKEDITFGIWDSKRLDIELKTQPQLVFEFFDGGLKPSHVEHFCGLDKIKDLFYNIPKIEYSPIENYIPRKLLKQDITRFYKQGENEESLITLFENKENPLRICILSTAGDGKTSDLQQLACHFSQITSPDSLFPILVRLKDYVDEKLPDLLEEYCPDWKKIDQKRLLVIFDGYDEIKDTVKEDLNRKISRLANTNPLMNIVVSSRNNGIDKDIDQFETYYLQKLSLYGEVREYIWGKLSTKTDTFIHLMFRNKMDDLLLTPFYLVKLTHLYHESPDDFPENRNEVFDKIIALINREEINSNRISASDWEDIEDIQNILLGKVAITMLLMGKNSFDSKNYKDAITDKTERTILEKSPLFKNHRGNVEFTHNLFQEYLTAQLLSKQSFETIKKCISFEPDFEKIKPKWTNTLASLFSLLPKDSSEFNDLLAFIIQSDHSLLIRFEHDKVSLDERFHIFKKILESEDRDYRNYSHSDLINFAGIKENEQVIKYLLEHINPQNQKKTRELTYLLRYADPKKLFGLENEIETVLKTVLSDKTYEDEIHEDALDTFASLNLANPELVKWLMIHKPSFKFKNVICVVFKIINQLGIVDEYIDFYLDSIPICNKELIKDGITRNTGVKLYFYAGIHSVKLTSSLHKILDYIIKHDSKFERRDKLFCRDDFKEKFAEKLFNQLITGYKSDQTLFNKVVKLIEKKLYQSYNEDFFFKAEPFFKETVTTEKAFWYFWNHKKGREIRWYIRSLFTCWVDKPIIDKWVKRYKRKYYNDEDVNDLKFGIFRNNQRELLQYFLDEMEKAHGKRPDYPVFSNNDYEAKRNERRNNDLEVLLNRPLFIELIHQVIQQLDGDISLRKLSHLDWEENKINCDLPFYYLEAYFEEHKKITITDIVSEIKDDEKWECYVVTELRKRIKDKEESPSIPEIHIDYLKKWCYNLLPSLNFQTARRVEDNKEWYRINEEYFAFFFRHIDLEVSQDVLLAMLSFDEHGIYDWMETEHHKTPPLSDIVIQKVNDIELVKKQILENLDKEIKVSGVLGNHFRLCRKLKINEANPYILTAIKKDVFDSYYGVILVDIYLELNGSISDFAFRLDSFSPVKEAHWHILEKLSTKGTYQARVNTLIEEYLNSNDEISEENKYKAMNQLIVNNHIRGLIEFKKYYENTQFDSHRSQRWESLANIPFEDSIEHWEEILQIAIRTGKNIRNFHRRELEGFVFGIFKAYAINNEEIFNQIRVIVRKYIQDNSDDSWSLKDRLQWLENEFYLNKIDIPTVKKAQMFCEEIGLKY